MARLLSTMCDELPSLTTFYRCSNNGKLLNSVVAAQVHNELHVIDWRILDYNDNLSKRGMVMP